MRKCDRTRKAKDTTIKNQSCKNLIDHFVCLGSGSIPNRDRLLNIATRNKVHVTKSMSNKAIVRAIEHKTGRKVAPESIIPYFPDDNSKLADDLPNMGVNTLKTLASERNIPGRSRATTKEDLVNLIRMDLNDTDTPIGRTMTTVIVELSRRFCVEKDSISNRLHDKFPSNRFRHHKNSIYIPRSIGYRDVTSIRGMLDDYDNLELKYNAKTKQYRIQTK